ncbi:hypothetical protein BDV06DRAFT_171904 [Aspergillus oleicola]
MMYRGLLLFRSFSFSILFLRLECFSLSAFVIVFEDVGHTADIPLTSSRWLLVIMKDNRCSMSMGILYLIPSILDTYDLYVILWNKSITFSKASCLLLRSII